MNSPWLNQFLEMLQNFLANFGVAEASRPVGALILLYVVVTLAVFIFVFLIWSVSRCRLRREPASTEAETGSGTAAMPEPAEASGAPIAAEAVAGQGEEPVAPGSVMDKLRFGLGRTRDSLVGRLDNLFQGQGGFSQEMVDELEEILITSDFGMPTTVSLIESLKKRFGGSSASSDEVYTVLKEEISDRLKQACHPVPDTGETPRVIMMVGVNGVGKTTTIGKLASLYQAEGKKVLLGAGDTFRAAAAGQLAVWGERAGVDLVRHQEGGDPAAVAFDAVKAAIAREVDLLIVDTAGRLHTKANLMEELKKVCRVLNRELEGAPHQILLVVDATTGQNALAQARLFKEAVNVDGIVLTKLDGTAKGGIIVAISSDLKIPVHYIGIGEAIDDLRPFDPDLFVAALFGQGDGA